MKVIVCIEDPMVIKQILEHLKHKAETFEPRSLPEGRAPSAGLHLGCLTDDPENQWLNSTCSAHSAEAGIRRAGWPEWSRLRREEDGFSAYLALCQPDSGGIARLSGDTTAVSSCWTWVKRAFIHPILRGMSWEDIDSTRLDMIHCFISFPTLVQDDAKFLKAQLEELYPENLTIFLACNPTAIRPGQKWYEEIIKNLSLCDRLLVLIPTFDVSPWVMFEAGAAFVQKKWVIPLRYHGLDQEFLPDPLAPIQSLSLGDEQQVKQLLRELATGKVPAHERTEKFARNIAEHFRNIAFRNRVAIERQAPLPPMRERIAYLSICSQSQRDLFYTVLQIGRQKGVLESKIRNRIKIAYSHHGEDECPGLHISPSEYYYRLRELYHLGLLEMNKIKAFHNRWYVPKDVQEEIKRLDPTLLSGAK